MGKEILKEGNEKQNVIRKARLHVLFFAYFKHAGSH